MDIGAQHSIIGDQDFGTNLPETVVPERDLTIEKNAARFSKTKEYKALKAHLESRIELYKLTLPGGATFMEAATTKDMAELGRMALASSTIITEFEAVLAFYEQSREIVEDAALS